MIISECTATDTYTCKKTFQQVKIVSNKSSYYYAPRYMPPTTTNINEVAPTNRNKTVLKRTDAIDIIHNIIML